MPSKNAIKLYMENGFYHIYNRGVAKNPIFHTKQDYLVFLSYLKEYLSEPKTFTPEELQSLRIKYFPKNYHNEITLITYCLLPNHFHLIIKQNKSRSIESFLRSLLTRYVMYFNKNYKRVGHLFQDVYKAILINNDEYLLWLTRYIHRNPVKILPKNKNLIDYAYSSYPVYLGKYNIPWLNNEIILSQIKHYRQFVEGEEKDSSEPEGISKFYLEED